MTSEVPQQINITAEYDDMDQCHTIRINLNYDGVTAEDVAACVRAVFRPGVTVRPGWDDVTRSHRAVPEPSISVNGADPLTAPISKSEKWF